MASDFTKTDAPSLLRFRYHAEARQISYISPWQVPRKAIPEVACLVDPLFASQDNWISIGSENRAEFLRMRKRGFSEYLLPEEVFARFKIIYDELVRARVAISSALISQGQANEFCELNPEKGRPTGVNFVYRNGTLWSSFRTLTQ